MSKFYHNLATVLHTHQFGSLLLSNWEWNAANDAKYDAPVLLLQEIVGDERYSLLAHNYATQLLNLLVGNLNRTILQTELDAGNACYNLCVEMVGWSTKHAHDSVGRRKGLAMGFFFLLQAMAIRGGANWLHVGVSSRVGEQLRKLTTAHNAAEQVEQLQKVFDLLSGFFTGGVDVVGEGIIPPADPDWSDFEGHRWFYDTFRAQSGIRTGVYQEILVKAYAKMTDYARQFYIAPSDIGGWLIPEHAPSESWSNPCCPYCVVTRYHPTEDDAALEKAQKLLG